MPCHGTTSLFFSQRCCLQTNSGTARPGGAPSHGPARLDTANLEATVRELFTAGLAESTRKIYQSGERRYLSFCPTLGESPYLTTERSLARFISHIYNQGLSASTMKGCLAAIGYGQISLSLGDPVTTKMSQLQYVLKGVRRNTAWRPGRTRLLVMPEILECMRQVWEQDPSRQDAMMLWAASTLCFFAFLRMGEAVAPSDSGFDPRYHLTYGDVRLNSATDPSWMEEAIEV